MEHYVWEIPPREREIGREWEHTSFECWIPNTNHLFILHCEISLCNFFSNSSLLANDKKSRFLIKLIKMRWHMITLTFLCFLLLTLISTIDLTQKPGNTDRPQSFCIFTLSGLIKVAGNVCCSFSSRGIVCKTSNLAQNFNIH